MAARTQIGCLINSEWRKHLLLAAHLDAAFDGHLISFDAEGQIQFGPKLSREDIAALGLTPEMRLRRTDPETEHRLALHRNKITGA